MWRVLSNAHGKPLTTLMRLSCAPHLEVIGDGGQGVDLAGLAVEEEQAAVKCLDKRIPTALAVVAVVAIVLGVAVVVSGIPVCVRVGVQLSCRPHTRAMLDQ